MPRTREADEALAAGTVDLLELGDMTTDRAERFAELLDFEDSRQLVRNAIIRLEARSHPSVICVCASCRELVDVGVNPRVVGALTFRHGTDGRRCECAHCSPPFAWGP